MILKQVAKVLRVPTEAIKSFTEEAAYNIIGNTYNDNSSILGTYHFNPIDKILELYESKID